MDENGNDLNHYTGYVLNYLEIFSQSSKVLILISNLLLELKER